MKTLKTFELRSTRLALALALVLSGSAPLSAQCCNVNLDGSQENPPVSPAGTGSATVSADSTTRTVTISGTFTNLTSTVTGAHLHGPAPADMNAGILIPLSTTGTTSGTFSGAGVLSVARFADFQNGLTYLNVHSANNLGGEIRGQVTCSFPSASTATRNGSGANPATCQALNVPQLGQTWDVTVDIVTPGALFSVLGFFFGGTTPGVATGLGELLCLPPFLKSNSATGTHSVPIPNDCSFLGLSICTQALTVAPGPVFQFTNAIDIVIGI